MAPPKRERQAARAAAVILGFTKAEADLLRNANAATRATLIRSAESYQRADAAHRRSTAQGKPTDAAFYEGLDRRFRSQVRATLSPGTKTKTTVKPTAAKARPTEARRFKDSGLRLDHAKTAVSLPRDLRQKKLTDTRQRLNAYAGKQLSRGRRNFRTSERQYAKELELWEKSRRDRRNAKRRGDKKLPPIVKKPKPPKPPPSRESVKTAIAKSIQKSKKTEAEIRASLEARAVNDPNRKAYKASSLLKRRGRSARTGRRKR